MDNCQDHKIRGSLWPLDPCGTHLTFRTQPQAGRRHVLEEECTDAAGTVTPLCKSQGGILRCKLRAPIAATPGFWGCVEHRGESHSHRIKSHITAIRRRDPLIWGRQSVPFSWLEANGGWASEVAPCWAHSLWIIVCVDSLLIDSKATREPFSSPLSYLTWFYFPQLPAV